MWFNDRWNYYGRKRYIKILKNKLYIQTIIINCLNIFLLIFRLASISCWAVHTPHAPYGLFFWILGFSNLSLKILELSRLRLQLDIQKKFLYNFKKNFNNFACRQKTDLFSLETRSFSIFMYKNAEILHRSSYNLDIKFVQSFEKE